MSDRNDIDALMIGGLYDELDATDKARLDSHLEGNPQARRELDALRRTRAALRELPEVEPPPAVSAMLMHEAAKHAPARRAVQAEPTSKGFFAWFAGLFQSLAMHPAAAAMATLVLVGGVAGTLYLRNQWRKAEPQVSSQAPAPVAGPDTGTAAPAAAAQPIEVDTLNAFAVDLATQGDLSRNEREHFQSETIAATTVDPNKNMPARGAGNEKDRWLETNAVSGTDPLLDGTEGSAAGAPGAGDSFGRFADQQAAGEKGGTGGQAQEELRPTGGAKIGGIMVETPEPTVRDSVATDADKADGASPPEDKAVAQGKTKAPAKPEAPPAPPPGTNSEDDGKVYRAPPREDTGEDAKTVEWAKSQHGRLRTAFKSKKCADVARLANDILDRAPDYYLSALAGSKDIKGCQVYVNQEARKRGELRAKSRANRANPAALESDASD